MSFKILTTPPFEKELKQLATKYPSIKDDIIDLSNQLIANPVMGILLAMIATK